MELGGYGFEKPELLKIVEEIYSCKGKKRDLELQLSTEKFHASYIPKRKDMLERELTLHLAVIIPFTLLILGAIALCVGYFAEYEETRYSGSAGVALLFSALLIIFGGKEDIKLIIREARTLMRLYISRNPEKAMQFASKYDINTLQSDEAKTNERLELLEAEIAELDNRIEELTKRQNDLLEEQKKREQVLREKGVLFDEDPNKVKQDGKFTLKEDAMGTLDAREIHEFYRKEEEYIINQMTRLKGKLEHVNKEITELEDDFETVKKQLIFSAIIYILIAIVQSAFTGVLASLTSIVCIIGSVGYIFYLERKCFRPIILYLVEHDSPLTKEYAFCNNMVPVRNKRFELMEMIKHQEKELVDIRERKDKLEFY